MLTRKLLLLSTLTTTALPVANAFSSTGTPSVLTNSCGSISTFSTSFTTRLTNDEHTTPHYDDSSSNSNTNIIFKKAARRLKRKLRNIDANEESSANKRRSLRFNYDCSVLSTKKLYCENNADEEVDMLSTELTKPAHKAVLLIQPIGVGIGRWYYDRLLRALQSNEFISDEALEDISFVAPDLLGCGTASRPDVIVMHETDEKEEVGIGSSLGTTNIMSFQGNLPLLTVRDWADQLVSLMCDFDDSIASSSIEWTIVANGGCVPICLEIGRRYVSENVSKSSYVSPSKISSLILTAPPRLSGLLMDKPVLNKTLKSYKTLCGIVGKAFWWYSLRRNGAFIQNFSEKNLAANKETLGEQWQPTCVETAKSNDGFSRFSTFAFLSGALQGGCSDSLGALKGKLPIYVVQGRDTRKNPTRSWFWVRRRKGRRNYERVVAENSSLFSPEMSLSEFLGQNGNDGTEKMVGGRRCIAHEDAVGFASALIDLISIETQKPEVLFNLGTWQVL